MISCQLEYWDRVPLPIRLILGRVLTLKKDSNELAVKCAFTQNDFCRFDRFLLFCRLYSFINTQLLLLLLALLLLTTFSLLFISFRPLFASRLFRFFLCRFLCPLGDFAFTSPFASFFLFSLLFFFNCKSTRLLFRYLLGSFRFKSSREEISQITLARH